MSARNLFSAATQFGTGKAILGLISIYNSIFSQVDAQYLLSKGSGGGETRTADQLHADLIPDPTLYCTSFKKRRFYCFSRREPNELKEPRFAIIYMFID